VRTYEPISSRALLIRPDAEKAQNGTTIQARKLNNAVSKPKTPTCCPPTRADEPDCDYYFNFASFKGLPFLILLILGQATIWILVFAAEKFYSANPVSSYTFLTQMFQKQGADGFLPWVFVGFPFYALFYTLCALSFRSKILHIFVFCFCLLCIGLWPLDTLCYLRPQSAGYDSSNCVLGWWFNYIFINAAIVFYVFFALSSHIIKSKNGKYSEASQVEDLKV